MRWPRPPEQADPDRYDAVMRSGIAELVAGMQWSGLLLNAYPEFTTDGAWQATASAAFRLWQGHLDVESTDVPPGYALGHARLLRWASAVAADGGDFERVFAARDLHQRDRAIRRMAQVPILYRDLLLALRQVSGADEA